MTYVDFISKLHKKTHRNYIERVVSDSKADCAVVAKQFGKDYWDGDRKYGYGGYAYDGRWRVVAEEMAEYYKLKPGQKVLDVGCGKGFLLYELTQVVPGLIVEGIDISQYAIDNSKEEVRQYLRYGLAQDLLYEDKSFDLVYSIGALHNLYIFDLKRAVEHIQRVSKGNSYIMVESYRNEQEKANLLYWQLTCESFFSTEEWQWLYKEWGYTGDYSYIFFE
ncbi:class I SAM-dependent methyltransferase [Acetivibrio cellulolyticus]|uniref:class I SAM-dependent methyltransferase n=1 Tax=Acetivibrio cellulolyticus TaxID=35830 RepID=UPI0001E2FB42|nr:class I SAM-dependent methyltransferase [Acetivibrio cellulolyticus]